MPDQNFIEPCARCKGKGIRFYGRGTPPVECNTCKGVGTREFQQPADVRERTRAKTKERKARKLAERIASFKADHPRIWEWMETADTNFARSLRDALLKWGGLTDAQHVVAARASAGTYRKARLL